MIFDVEKSMHFGAKIKIRCGICLSNKKYCKCCSTESCDCRDDFKQTKSLVADSYDGNALNKSYAK